MEHPLSTQSIWVLIWIWLTPLEEMGRGRIWLYQSSRLQQDSHQTWLLLGFKATSAGDASSQTLHTFILCFAPPVSHYKKLCLVSCGVRFSHLLSNSSATHQLFRAETYGTQRNQIPLNICKDVLRPKFFCHGENSLPATCKHCSADDTEE